MLTYVRLFINVILTALHCTCDEVLKEICNGPPLRYSFFVVTFPYCLPENFCLTRKFGDGFIFDDLYVHVTTGKKMSYF